MAYLNGIIIYPNNTNYGWESNLTLDDWKEECARYFLSSNPDVFLEWQLNGLKKLADGKSIKDFNISKLNCTINLNNQVFDSQIEAENYIYKIPVDFSNSIFKYETHFSFSKFEDNVLFNDVVFEHEAYFGQIEFNKRVDFNRVIFNNLSAFSGSVFKLSTSFNSVRFTRLANFSSVLFEGEINFNIGPDNKISKIPNKGTIFGDSTYFENAVFKKVGHFENAKFLTEYPNFLGVDNANTFLVFGGESSFNEISKVDGNSVNNLIQLKRLSEEHGQVDNTLLFNKLEIETKAKIARNLTKPFYSPKNLFQSDFWFANVAGLYGLLSDYGRSYIRPLLAYFTLLIITFFLALTFTFKSNNINSINKFDDFILSKERAAFEYSLYKSTGFVDFSDTGKSIDKLNLILFNQPFEPIEMRIWGLFKSISSLICLFLFGLGIRNKFRIK